MKFIRWAQRTIILAIPQPGAQYRVLARKADPKLRMLALPDVYSSMGTESPSVLSGVHKIPTFQAPRQRHNNYVPCHRTRNSWLVVFISRRLLIKPYRQNESSTTLLGYPNSTTPNRVVGALRHLRMETQFLRTTNLRFTPYSTPSNELA